jgi:hypothetical protein
MSLEARIERLEQWAHTGSTVHVVHVPYGSDEAVQADAQRKALERNSAPKGTKLTVCRAWRGERDDMRCGNASRLRPEWATRRPESAREIEVAFRHGYVTAPNGKRSGHYNRDDHFFDETIVIQYLYRAVQLGFAQLTSRHKTSQRGFPVYQAQNASESLRQRVRLVFDV